MLRALGSHATPLRALAAAIAMAALSGCAKEDPAPPPVEDPGKHEPEAEQISIRASPSRAVAGGQVPVRIVVAVSTSSGVMVSDREVVLESSVPDDVLEPASGKTRHSGAFVSSLTGTAPGVRKVVARVGDAIAIVEVELYTRGGPACAGDLLMGGQPPALASWPDTLEATALFKGDLDGDGREDLLVTLSASNSRSVDDRGGRIFVRMHDEDGRPVDATMHWPAPIRAAALADFDGDGILDLAVASQESDWSIASEMGTERVSGTFIDLLTGKGDGSFDQGARTTVGDWREVELAGIVLGGQTRARLVATFGDVEAPFPRLKSWRTDDDGDWEPVSEEEFWALEVVPTDLDGDDRLDLVVSGFMGLEFWTEAEDGGFVQGEAPDAEMFVFHAGDLDGDGLPDLAGTDMTSQIAFLPGLGDGTFGELRTWGIGDRSSVWIGPWDQDGDGSLDLLVAAFGVSPPELHVLRGDGSGAFDRHIDLGPMPVSPLRGFAIADVDGAGPRPVLLGKNVLASMHSDPDGLGKWYPAAHRVSNPGSFFASGRFHLGGALSFAIGSWGATTYRFVGGDYLPINSLSIFAHLVSMTVRADPELAGTDGVVALYADGTLSILSAWGEEALVPFVSDEPALAVASADFDGDGREDLAISTRNSVFTLISHPDGSFHLGPVSRGAGGIAIAAGDFDGDGRMDVAVTGRETFLLRGDGAGGLTPTHRFALSGGSLAIADVDLDGLEDVIVAESPGTISVIVSSATGEGVTSYDTGGRSFALAVGDLDGDGLPDIAASGPGDTLAILRNTGDGTFTPAVHYPAGTEISGLALGPFSGSGRTELLLLRADGDVHLLPVACGAAP